MEIQDGDIVFLERCVRLREGQWVDSGTNSFGHVEICNLDGSDGAENRDQEKVTKWLEDRERFTRQALVIARARVYRCRAPALERERVAAAVDYLAHGATFGTWRAVTSVFRSKKATCRELSGKYFERVMRLCLNPEDAPAHVMKRLFCSELVVTATQIGAMLAVAPIGPVDTSNDEINRILSRAKQHRLWLDTRAKATTPSGLEHVLRSSANWDYLGLYTDSDDDEDLLRLKSVVVRAIAHYNDRTTLGVFKWTSGATTAWLTVLRELLNRPPATANSQGLTAAMLRHAIACALPGLRLAPGRQSTPWAEGGLMPHIRPLDRDSRFYRCLLLAASQGASDQFQFDANELNRVRRAR